MRTERQRGGCPALCANVVCTDVMLHSIQRSAELAREGRPLGLRAFRSDDRPLADPAKVEHLDRIAARYNGSAHSSDRGLDERGPSLIGIKFQ